MCGRCTHSCAPGRRLAKRKAAMVARSGVLPAGGGRPRHNRVLLQQAERCAMLLNATALPHGAPGHELASRDGAGEHACGRFEGRRTYERCGWHPRGPFIPYLRHVPAERLLPMLSAWQASGAHQHTSVSVPCCWRWSARRWSSVQAALSAPSRLSLDLLPQPNASERPPLRFCSITSEDEWIAEQR